MYPLFFEMLLGYLIFGSSIDSPVNFLKNDDIGSMFIFLPASAQLRTFLELFMVLCCSSCIKPSPFLVTYCEFSYNFPHLFSSFDSDFFRKLFCDQTFFRISFSQALDQVFHSFSIAFSQDYFVVFYVSFFWIF